MAGLISWEFNSASETYTFKVTGDREIKVKGVWKVMMEVELNLLRQVKEMGITRNNHSEGSSRLMRLLNERFYEQNPEDADALMGKVVAWRFLPDYGRVEVLDGVWHIHSYHVHELLVSDDIAWLEQFLQVVPDSPSQSQGLTRFLYCASARVEQMKQLPSEITSEEEEEELGSDPDDAFYQSDVVPHYDEHPQGTTTLINTVFGYPRSIASDAVFCTICEVNFVFCFPVSNISSFGCDHVQKTMAFASLPS